MSIRHPRFHVSIGGVLSAMLLLNAIQAFVVGIDEPLGFGLSAVVNWFIKKEHYDVLFLRQDQLSWSLMYWNFLIGIICLVTGLGLASRIYASGKKAS
ncbi:MAG TPA: hypothetical protein VFW31_13170 [Candidatus Angelobacter sp.]|nr:hypothetical protein [Candidatus Angelobacter sp.]